MTAYIGVDGCRAGWLAVVLHEGGEHECAIFASVNKLWATHKDAQTILIDVPIGLPEQGARLCDIEARRVLGRRSSSIFNVPTRSAIYAAAYSEGTQINQLLTGKMFSRQLWNIAPRIREMDALLRMDAFAREAFKEAHPEVVFWGLAGKPMTHPKKSNAGYTERITVLERFYPGAALIVDEAMNTFKRREVLRDDLVDALANAVAAKLDHLVTLPITPEHDAYDLPMRITYASRPGLVRLHHAQITIPTGSEAQARAFYCTLLGLHEIPKPESLQGRGGFWVELGDVQIHIGTEDGDARSQTKAHLAYQVTDIAHWQQKLQENGIEIGDSVPIPGYQRFEFRDPFGNRVEFIQPAES